MKGYIAIACILILIFLVGCQLPEGAPPEERAPGVIEEEAAEEVSEEEPTEPFIVKLTAEKTMEPSNILIKAGTTVIWQNEDNYPHHLMIYMKTKTDLKEEDIIRSQNFFQGESFEHTFTEKGEYIVRDVYSGDMRGEITADVVKTTGIELGTIIVE